MLLRDGDPLEILKEAGWHPEPQQLDFLKSKAFEHLFGGRAGCGKTDVLIVDALGLFTPGGPAICNPKYSAVMIRPARTELAEVITRTKNIYKLIDPGAEYLESKNHWKFSSGATIYFDFLRNAEDRFKYRGFEYQHIGWEELTLHGSKVPYEYLLGRVRKTTAHGKINLKVRATTNPDGPGHDWVQERWGIPDEGGATRSKQEFEVVHPRNPKKTHKVRNFRVFQPGKLSKHVDPSYIANLMMASEQQRRAHLEGRWDIVDLEGVVYKPQLESVLEDDRYRDLPVLTGVPVNTFWDLGRSDKMAICFHQQDGPWHNFIDYYEMSGQGVDHFAAMLRDRGYQYGKFFLPHDATHLTASSWMNKSFADLLKDHGFQDIVIVPRIQSLDNGIELTRQAFAQCRFDKGRGKRLFTCLQNYRYKLNEDRGVFELKPIHNKYSHGADAYRQFAQSIGRLRATVTPTKHRGPRHGAQVVERKKAVNWRV